MLINRIVKTVYSEKQPFKNLENYFTDFIIYQEEHRTNVGYNNCPKMDSVSKNDNNDNFSTNQFVQVLYR